MLRDFGVKEVRVQEVVSLDHEMLASLPYDHVSLFFLCSKVLRSQPVYGLVFLFKWRAEDPDKQEQICPEGIWFANQVRRHDYLLPAAAKDSQTAKDACASVALLNIVNNIPEIELGENLRQFKNFTTDFTPSLRGDAISNFDFVKAIHNSFAR